MSSRRKKPGEIETWTPYWSKSITSEAHADLLPGHPWLCRRDLVESGLVVVGSEWVTCVDLVVERNNDYRPFARLRGPLSMIRVGGRRVGRDLSGLRGYWAPIDLLPAGTALRVTGTRMGDRTGYDERWWNIDFAVPDGRWMWVTVEQEAPSGVEWESEPRRALSWWDLACAAVIVPAGHPLAWDEAAAEALLTSVEAAAKEAEATTPSDHQ